MFQALIGIVEVEQGFLRSHAPADTWAEAVIVTFDPSAIDLVTLCEVHLRTHSATRSRPVRSKYRSAIYVFKEAQRAEADLTIARLAEEFGKPVHTSVLPFADFKASDARFQNYYRTDPTRPFCRTYIDPKLALLRRQFASVTAPIT